MEQIYRKLESEVDGLLLDTLTVLPEKEPHGIVQLVHGMAEYKERYMEVMHFLAGHGYVCIIHDHRGHGESVETAEDYGYLYDTSGTALVLDAHQVTELVKQDYPDLPLYLFGHSMGSLVVRAYTKRYDAEIDGLIVCGSPSANPLIQIAKLLAKTLLTVKGKRAGGKLLHKMAFSTYLDGIEDPKSENDWLSFNEANVTAYDNDPKCGFVFTANGFYNLFCVLEDTYNKKGWAMTHPDLPVFFISGEEDPCMTNKEAFEDAIRTMREVGYQNTKAKLYPHMRHEILNEDGKELVYEDLIRILERFAAGK